jgi:hypothetical protein
MQDIAKPTSSVISYDVYNLPPSTNLNVLLNDIDCTPLVSPDNGLIGDPIKTDITGRAKGKIVVLSSYAIQLGGNDLTIKFIDKTTAKVYAQVMAIGSGISGPGGGISSGFVRAYDSIPSNNGSAAVPGISTVALQGGEAGFTPLTQTFSVDATRYPYGVVLTSVELYVAIRDTEIPLAIEIRNLENGLPSSSSYIQGSSVVVAAKDINVPTAGNIGLGLGPSTKFTFPKPIYLSPGKHALCVLSNSKYYYLYAGTIGSPILGSPEETINKEPYSGTLYKPQNTNIWLEQTSTDICFKLNKAVFETGSKTFEVATANTSYNEFDNLFLDAKQYTFDDQNSISYKIKTTDIGGYVEPFTSFKENAPTKLVIRSKIQNQNDAAIQVTMSNSNKDITPAIDKSHSGLYSFKNLIDPYSDLISATEISPYNGLARSKYLSKAVQLQDGFDSTGLEVNLDVNRKTGTDIDVFCRVFSALDNSKNASILNNSWVKMPLFNQSANVDSALSITGRKNYAGLDDLLFYNETYKVLEGDSLTTTGTANLKYSANVGDVVTTFDTFNQFQIKVVFYSSDTTVVPKIKNIIATAVV